MNQPSWLILPLSSTLFMTYIGTNKRWRQKKGLQFQVQLKRVWIWTLLNPQLSFSSVSELLLSCKTKINRKINSYQDQNTSETFSTLGYHGLGKRENLNKLHSQSFREVHTTPIGCPCDCCILDICLGLFTAVILVFIFYFVIHKYLI